MQLRLIPILARLLVLLLAVQAVMPRELVWCVQPDGDIALELSHRGRCVGAVDSGCCEHGGELQTDTTVSLLAQQEVGCDDILLSIADARAGRWDRIAAPGPESASTVYPQQLSYFLLPVWTIQTKQSQPAARTAMRTPLRLVLRI